MLYIDFELCFYLQLSLTGYSEQKTNTLFFSYDIELLPVFKHNIHTTEAAGITTSVSSLLTAHSLVLSLESKLLWYWWQLVLTLCTDKLL